MNKEITEKLKDKTVLITGGTGSLGQALTKRLLKTNVKIIRIFSRNENKQVTMESTFNDDRLRFLIGDIRDLPRLITALEDIDIVFHLCMAYIDKMKFDNGCKNRRISHYSN